MTKKAAHLARDAVLWEYWPEEIARPRWHLRFKSAEGRHDLARSLATIPEGRTRKYLFCTPQDAPDLPADHPVWSEWRDPFWDPPRDPRTFFEEVRFVVGRPVNDLTDWDSDVTIELDMTTTGELCGALSSLGSEETEINLIANEDKGVLYLHPEDAS